jgi:hypothetical protein
VYVLEPVRIFFVQSLAGDLRVRPVDTKRMQFMDDDAFVLVETETGGPSYAIASSPDFIPAFAWVERLGLRREGVSHQVVPVTGWGPLPDAT